MKERNKSIGELAEELPRKFIVRKTLSINFSPTELSKAISTEDRETDNGREGIRVSEKEGSLLIIPDKGGKAVRILAEAETAEIAEEMCLNIEDLINRIDMNN